MFNVNKNVLFIYDNPGLLWSRRFVYTLNSWPREMDVVTSTKRSRGHDIISRSHDLICRGHEKLSEPNSTPPGHRRKQLF